MSEILVKVTGLGEDGLHGAADAATGLIRELRTRGGLDARMQTGTSVAGQKSGAAISIGDLVVSGIFSAATVSALARIAVAYIRRGAARKITLKDGERSLVISDPSADTERAVADWLRTSVASGDESAEDENDSGRPNFG